MREAKPRRVGSRVGVEEALPPLPVFVGEADHLEEIVQAAGFYEAVEREVFVPAHPTPVPDCKGLVRGDTGEYLAVVGKEYEVVQVGDIARCLVQAPGDVWCIFTTAGTLGRARHSRLATGRVPFSGTPSRHPRMRAASLPSPR